MKKQYIDQENKFIEIFNDTDGFYLRTGVIEKGKDTNVDPFQRNFPSLLDIGIMGSCHHAKFCKVGCYQGDKNIPNMSLDDYKSIIDQCKGKVFQVALGGKGDPNKHKNFAEILKYTRENRIVPNYTTSGYNLTEEEVEFTKQYCGACAVSFYRADYTYKAIEMLRNANVQLNIHYVLSNSTIDEATTRLENNDFPEGINAVVFLLHKPVGLGSEKDVLNVNDPKVKKFFELVNTMNFNFKIGFDSCSIPGVINFTNKISMESIDTCEAARFSAYITPDMKLLPCSFDNQEQTWAVDLYTNTIQDAWNSKIFEHFRSKFRYSCLGCSVRDNCMGGCPIKPKIVLCNRPEKIQISVLNIMPEFEHNIGDDTNIVCWSN